MTRTVSDVGWEPDGTILVTFLESQNIRCEGAVALRQTIRIEPTSQYAPGIQAVADAVHELLRDALEDWRSSPAAEDTQERVLGAEPLDELQLGARRHIPDADDEDEDSLLERRKWAGIEAARAPS